MLISNPINAIPLRFECRSDPLLSFGRWLLWQALSIYSDRDGQRAHTRPRCFFCCCVFPLETLFAENFRSRRKEFHIIAKSNTERNHRVCERFAREESNVKDNTCWAITFARHSGSSVDAITSYWLARFPWLVGWRVMCSESIGLLPCFNLVICERWWGLFVWWVCSIMAYMLLIYLQCNPIIGANAIWHFVIQKGETNTHYYQHLIDTWAQASCCCSLLIT